MHGCPRHDAKKSKGRNDSLPTTRALTASCPSPAIMSRRTLSLPIRTLSSVRPSNPQWVCRRCLATQSGNVTASPTPDFLHAKEPSPDNYDPTLPASQRIGPDGKPYRLKKSDFYLKKMLPQKRIPDQYLLHSTSEILHVKEKKQRELLKPHKKIVGVVVSAGKMDKTVKVRIATQIWNTRIKKVRASGATHA